MTSLNRRALLTTGAAAAMGAGAIAFTGCSASPSSAPSSAGDGTALLSPGTFIAMVSTVPVGGTARARVGDVEVVLAQPVEGTVVAFSAICTHQGCIVAPVNSEFDCPCHGARYDGATGEVLSGPAPSPLASIPVTIDGSGVVAA